ncbi:sugar ABC transporter permease [Archangium sp.]|uniref:carbohydrate ABC transporter permease n=1 Tax=Archangium sp. TaxID=1872627 RepID=UPI002D5CCB92|nr:sugar ABC transporter permease [Archangium sp.]HYO56955.1 sugar ABC transporter permease [Archangium sp.]
MQTPLTPTVPGAAEAPALRAARSAQPRWAPYLFLAPFLAWFAAFALFPLLFTLFLSLHNWDAASGLETMQFAGWSNYQFNLTDPWFWKSLWNTLWLAMVSGLPQHLVALPLAFFLHSSFRRWRNLVVGMYFLPFITSTVAIALIFSALFSADYGLINQTLDALHRLPLIGALFPAEHIDWINQAVYIKPAVAMVVFWRFIGWNTVLYLSAMQTIPEELYEAAALDGAGKWRQFWHVTVPMVRPMMFFAVTLTIIGGLQLFEEPFILTPDGRGGSDNAAMTTAMYLYRTAFDFGEMGTAAALSWLLLLVIAALTWVNNLVFARGGLRDSE